MWKTAIILCATFVVSTVEMKRIMLNSYRARDEYSIKSTLESLYKGAILSNEVYTKVNPAWDEYINKEMSIINASITLASETLCEEFKECNVKLDTDIDAARTKVMRDIKSCASHSERRLRTGIKVEYGAATNDINQLQKKINKCPLDGGSRFYMDGNCTSPLLEKVANRKNLANDRMERYMKEVRRANAMINEDTKNGVEKFIKSDPCISKLKLEQFTSIHITPIIDRANECFNNNGGCPECE